MFHKHNIYYFLFQSFHYQQLNNSQLWQQMTLATVCATLRCAKAMWFKPSNLKLHYVDLEKKFKFWKVILGNNTNSEI